MSKEIKRQLPFRKTQLKLWTVHTYFAMNLHMQAFTLLLLILRVECHYFPNLRQFSSGGYGGVFSFPQEVLQNEIEQRLDGNWGFSMNLNGPQVWMFLSTVNDFTLQQEGVNGVAHEFFEVSFILPVLVGPHQQSGDLQLAHFTADAGVLNPYLVNYQETKVVDRIEKYSSFNKDQIVLYKGQDTMLIEVLKYGFSKREANDALLKRQANSFQIKTDYPNPLDWGCNEMNPESKASFCEVLEGLGFGAWNADPNVCNVNENVHMSDDGQYYAIQISVATGYFLDELPFLASQPLPISSDFAFYGNVVERVGIVFPCS